MISTTSSRGRAGAGRVLLHLALGAGVLLLIGPVLWALSSSFKPLGEIFAYPPKLIPDDPIVSNYTDLFARVPFGRWFLNSLLVSVVSTLAAVFFCALGGYGFAKYRFPGQRFLFDVMFSSMMIPFAVILVPLFVLVANLGWANTWVALIVPWVAPAFGIFMMRQYILQSIPDEVIEAARIDGCGEFMTFLRIVLPMLRPALGALAVWSFLNSYNSFIWPLVILSDLQGFTLPLGLNSLVGSYSREYGLVMAGTVLAAVPAIAMFVVLRKQLIQGLTLGSVKG